MVLQYALWSGRHNVFDLFFLKDQLSPLEQSNEQLRKRNNRLHAEVIDIKSRLGAIEEKNPLRTGFDQTRGNPHTNCPAIDQCWGYLIS
ncbi:MAG: hypothetical protein CM1200mP41_17730 [Gammaproteobacteria bacterium]|nr:MAG: hypothetical protein CM1200mP41_17730 [Gammaproteobacteria bacterium]